MKLKALLFLLLAATLPLAAPRAAQAADVSFDYFYDALLPHGEWIEVEGYGLCWRPTGVDPDWVPYSDGYWAFTDAGWTFVGYEEFAGIVYHYGRWMSVEDVGWCWVPDYEWGPAWVSWRHSDDYIGWAPLPPRAVWQPQTGFSTWVDTAYDIGPAFYSFCRVRDFGAPVLRPVLIQRSRNVVIIRHTVNITNITYNRHGDVPVIYNGGPSYVVINRRCERPVPALKLVRQTHFDRADFRGGKGGFSPNSRTVGNQLVVNAPIVAPPVQPELLKEKAKKVLRANKVANGWAGIKDGKEREELRQHFRRETKGLTPLTAPAKAVAAADLQVVPVEADPKAVPPGFGGKGSRGRGDHNETAVKPAVETPPVAKPVVVAPAAAPAIVPGQPEPRDREKGRAKNGGAPTPPVAAVPGSGIDPQVAGKPKRDQDSPPTGQEQLPPPVVAVPPVKADDPATARGPVQPRDSRGPKPKDEGRAGGFHPPVETKRPIVKDDRPAKPAGVDPTAAQAQIEAEAARVAREQAEAQKQEAELAKRRAAQAETDKARDEQERNARRREAEAGTAALREKQAADAAAAAAEKAKMEAAEKLRDAQNGREKLQAEQERQLRQRDGEAAATQQKQLEAQRQAEVARQAELKRQQAEAQALERQKQEQEQIVEQRRQRQIEMQKAAHENASKQAAERAREQQVDQQRAAQEAAKAQAAEQRRALEAERQQAARQQQLEQQRAAQEAAKAQAAEQRRALDAERQQAARQQQVEQQRAAQEAAKAQAAEQRRAHEAERQQAARQQQVEQQRAAQAAARQQAEAQRAAQPPPPPAQPQPGKDSHRGGKDKDKDKDKGQ